MGVRAGRRHFLAGVTAFALIGLAATGAMAEDVSRTRYAAPTTLCSVTDARLDAISGMAATRNALYVVNDTAPVTVYRLDSHCKVAGSNRLTIPATQDPAHDPGPVDIEDMAVDSDGALWLGDIGGNKAPRRVVSLYRWVPGGALDADTAGVALTWSEARNRPANRVTRYDLRYPDGTHDAEAVAVSLTGQIVLITKEASGVAGVYAADLPLRPAAILRRVGSLDLRAWLPGRPVSALAVTGAAVAPDGVHFAVRTHGAALEWDAPDGDLVGALATGVPRPLALGKAPQGEAIAYAEGRSALLTEGEQLPAPLGSVALRRQAGYAPPAGPVFPPIVLLGAGLTGVLCVAIGTIAWRRREGNE